MRESQAQRLGLSGITQLVSARARSQAQQPMKELQHLLEYYSLLLPCSTCRRSLQDVLLLGAINSGASPSLWGLLLEVGPSQHCPELAFTIRNELPHSPAHGPKIITRV